MNHEDDDDKELRITPLFVLNQLNAHMKECANRWWAVMRTLIAGFGGIILFLAGLVVTLVIRH